MSEIGHLAATIFRRAHGVDRLVVAIAGPPGSGKSTLSHELAEALTAGGQSAIVVPMDGFHFDDAVLEARGLSSRKGSPPTFDVAGFKVLLERIRANEPDIAIPVFDRTMELSRAAAAVIGTDRRVILVEGNYLLLDEEPWAGLAPLFDVTVFLDVPRAELERRLMQRWRDHGKTEEAARDWVAGNDLPNAEIVLARRRRADIVLS